MRKAIQLVSVVVLFLGAVIFVPFEKTTEMLQANLFETPLSSRTTVNMKSSAPIVPIKVSTVSTVTTLETKGLFEKSMGEFYLVHNKKGSERYLVPENTCENGVRILVQGLLESSNATATLHVYGLSRRTSRETYNQVLTLTRKNPVKVLHLPRDLVYNNNTLFPEYQITPSRNGDMFTYDVMCY